MKTFDDYLENIYHQDNKLVFDYSKHDDFNLKLRKIPYSSSSKRLLGHTVHTLYTLTAKETSILRALKGEGDSIIEDSDLEYFASRSASYAFKVLPTTEIDYILYSQNSYPLMDKFLNKLRNKFSSQVLKLSPSILKTSTDKLSLRDSIPAKYKDQAETLLLKLKQKDSIKLRNDIPKHLRMFFKGFITIDESILAKVENKNILIVDDILTVGTTFNQLFGLLQNYNPKNVYGLTLFKFR